MLRKRPIRIQGVIYVASMRDAPLIVATNLVKRYGPTVGLFGISFSVAPGEVVGLLGPNGAGKTTTLHILTGQIIADEGTALVCGIDPSIDSAAVLSCVGFVTANTALYARLTVDEQLRYFGRLYGLDEATIDARLATLSDDFGLASIRHRRAAVLSSGERQRVNLARAMMHNPRVVILDEPTVGLDVLASKHVADSVRQLRARGCAILFCTHYLSEAELLCDRLILIHRGVVLAQGSAHDVRLQANAVSLEQAMLHLIESPPPVAAD